METALAPTLLIHSNEQISISMDPDPCPAELQQQARFVAIVRMPLRQWVQYEYETGMFCLALQVVVLDRKDSILPDPKQI